MDQVKRFQKNDNGFICAHCGREVLPLGRSSRNHCPFCLRSLHVDVNPGDRLNECGGILDPIYAEPDNKKGFVIYFKCRRCGETVRCRAALDADTQSDDIGKLIRLTAHESI